MGYVLSDVSCRNDMLELCQVEMFEMSGFIIFKIQIIILSRLFKVIISTFNIAISDRVIGPLLSVLPLTCPCI